MPQTCRVNTLKNLCTKVLKKCFQILFEENRRLQLNDHLLLKPIYRELVEYLRRLPDSLLEYVTLEYMKHYEALKMIEAEHLVPDNLLLLALGVRLENILCYFSSISFPVVDFMRQYSVNISSLTLVSCDFISNLITLRTLLFWLRNLEELSIRSEKMSKYCVKLLAKEPLLPKLKVLRLKGILCQFDNDLKFPRLLSSRKKLQHLSYDGYIHFFVDLCQRNISLDLTELVVDISHEVSQVAALESMTECCKNLTSLDIRYYFKDGVEFLTKFKNLNTLKLRNQNMYLNTDLKPFLQNWPKLHTLFISYTGVISAKLFSESLPLLKDLSIHGCKFEESPVTPDCLPHLEHLDIRRPACDFTPDVIFEFLTSSFKLRSIKMDGKIDTFRTEKLLDVLAVNNLNYLEKFIVHYCHLSYEAVEALLNNSNNNLEFLHIESGSIYDDDVKLIKKLVLEENLSIYLKLRSIDNPKTIVIDNLHK